ncbi:two-component system response regulator RppA [Pantanalinema rosaneae CENA516]|uniref:two-component system response regulator RppA n=1 Tax=Pantanalinema rosaneae TaxID=1620701 RepID=UPI003D6EAC8D
MRILFVEDEPDLGEAVHQVLHQERYVVDWVQDGAEAWEYLNEPLVQYKLAVIDWMVPGLSGIELCRRLRGQGNPLPILMLTAKDQMADKVAGLDAGADDYLIKPFGMEELLARIRALLRRSPQFQSRQLQIGGLTLDYATSSLICHAPSGQQQIVLSAKEFQLLEYFMQHPNQILNRSQIMHQLWEMQAEPMSNVVAAQVRLLRRKLAEQGYDNLIETLYGLGYRFNANNAV